MSAFTDELVRLAETEFATYQGQFENAGELRARIGDYWEFLNIPGRDGASPYAWSAAFISYMAHCAGAEDSFPYSGQHSAYFYKLIRNRLQEQDAPFWGYRPEEIEIGRGDILGMNRSDGEPIDYEWAANEDDYLSHADIVVDIDDGGMIRTIGGNVGQQPGQIGQKGFSWVDGKLVNRSKPAQKVFVVLRSTLP